MQPYTRRRLVKDFATIIGVLLLPFIVYTYLLFPEEAKKVDVLFFTIDSGYFDTVQHMIWVGCIKLIHILTFLLWRTTIKSWWRNVLLLPVLFFIWQISAVFNVYQNELTSKNAKIIYLLSSEKFFNNSIWGSKQYNNILRLRCIEIKIPMIKSSNFGKSLVINSKGRILFKSSNDFNIFKQ